MLDQLLNALRSAGVTHVLKTEDDRILFSFGWRSITITPEELNDLLEQRFEDSLI